MKSEMRHVLARQSFEDKIRKVGELIRLAAKLKAERLGATTEDDAVLEGLDIAAAQLDAGKGVPLERVREQIHEWAKNPKK
jgi:UDP-N-acetylglucosamine enolpyruvyl transferase